MSVIIRNKICPNVSVNLFIYYRSKNITHDELKFDVLIVDSVVSLKVYSDLQNQLLVDAFFLTGLIFKCVHLKQFTNSIKPVI